MNEFRVPKTRYSGGETTPEFHRYVEDDSVAILLYEIGNEQLAFKATVCMVEIGTSPPDGHVWLKGWSANEGVPEALHAAGIVELTGETAPAGHAVAQLGKLTEAALNAIKEG